MQLADYGSSPLLSDLTRTPLPPLLWLSRITWNLKRCFLNYGWTLLAHLHIWLFKFNSKYCPVLTAFNTHFGIPKWQRVSKINCSAKSAADQISSANSETTYTCLLGYAHKCFGIRYYTSPCQTKSSLIRHNYKAFELWIWLIVDIPP